MDIATLGGLFGGLFLVITGCLFAGLNPLSILDGASALITFGGALAATVFSTPLNATLTVGKVTKNVINSKTFDTVGLINTLISFSEKARREGLLALEDSIMELSEEFLKKGMQLVVDGTDPELVRAILETEIENTGSRHGLGKGWWDCFSAMSPAFGMVGTLIGLIAMLQNLGGGDSSAIGAGMAAALITTLYGSLGSNLIAIPIVKKLTLNSETELLYKQVMLEGILSIQSGDNPRIVKDKLTSFLSPDQRDQLKDEG